MIVLNEVNIADIKRKLDTIAAEILRLTRSRLLLKFNFLDTAIGRLEIYNDDLVFQLATNGQRLYFCSQWVLETFKEEEQKLSRAYLHSILHCIFKHPFVSPKLNKKYWNLAADIAVENILSEMNNEQISCNGVQYQEQMLCRLKEEIRPITAEKVYKYLVDKNYSDDEVEKLAEYFYRDNHGLWWPDEEDEDKKDNEEGEGGEEQSIDMEELMKEWEEISKMLDVDLDTLSKDSDKSDSLIQNLKELNRDKYDYKEFLRKFSVRGEDMLINDEEFDYVYYTYGLSHYGNMPLIEPLEYKETEKINDFVIAIDTSGSVKGEVVQRFLNKTYSMLMMEESFFKKINMRIIQCDDKIQEEVKIESKEDFDTYMKNMKIKGFGGTDFKPVFSRIEELISAKEFDNLKGLIYFTDGYGMYPLTKPTFESAFIYLGYDPERPPTPPWAIKLCLDEEQLTEDLK